MPTKASNFYTSYMNSKTLYIYDLVYDLDANNMRKILITPPYIFLY